MTAAEKMEKELRDLAVTDWEKFKLVTELDTSTYAICQLRKQGKSLQQVANTLSVSKKTVRVACAKCLDQ